MFKTVVFNGENDCGVMELDSRKPDQGEVKIRSCYSLISTGTETTVLKRKFAPGTHWDNWVKYPFHPGYSMIGVVEEVGEGVQLEPGTPVAIRCAHSAENIVAENECYPVTGNIDLQQGAWFALAKIAFMGIRAGGVKLGSNVLVIGGGPIGQMAVRWCAAAGAHRIVLVDMMTQRLELARKGGATHVIGKPVNEATAEIEKAFGAKPDIVIDSTGNAAVFEQALHVAAHKAKVVVLGDTGTPAQQHLTSDVITRGLQIVGAHDSHCDAEWTQARIIHLFFTLVATGRFNMEGLNTHIFAPEDAAEAYNLTETDRANTMGILFKWC